MKIFRFILQPVFYTVFMLLPGNVFAQDPGPCADCPLDSGVVILIVAAISISVKKYHDAIRKRRFTIKNI